jgi:hypothetical protein
MLPLKRESRTKNMVASEEDSAQPFALTAVDRQVLGQTNEDFKAHTWEELRHIIGECRRFNVSLPIMLLMPNQSTA